MAQETYAMLWRAVRLYSPVLPATLAQNFIRSRFRDLRRKRLWSWRIGFSQFTTPNNYSVGTATVVFGSNTVTGSGTTWTTAMLGRQFRIGTVAPIYTVVAINSTTSLVIDQPFGGLSATNVGYQIFQAYITPTPTDFQDFISVKDTIMNWQLNLHTPQTYIDAVDAQRANTGTAYCLADLAYNRTTVGSGSVGPCTQVVGTGAVPFASGLYTGFTQSTYVITISTGGTVGTAQYTWRKDSGSTSGAQGTFTQPFVFDAGVTIQFPAGTYTLNDVFVVQVTPGFQSSMPMFELWPYSMSQRVYPYLYDRRFPDVDDPTWALPRYIDGDILVKGALADLFRYKGTSDVPNPSYDLNVAVNYEREFQAKVAEMEREDDEVFLDSVRYQLSMPTANLFAFGADFMQSHDFTA